jgi:hypothetical protein
MESKESADASGSSGLALPPPPPPPSALASLHDEVVLYYCACMVSYTSSDVVGSPGFLYVSSHYIGLASRSVIAVGAKRRDLLRLEDLHDVVISGGLTASSAKTPSKSHTATIVGSSGGHQGESSPAAAASSGWSLASIQQSLKIANVTTGCKLRFKLPVLDGSSAAFTTPSETNPGIGNISGDYSAGGGEDSVTFEVTVFPALVEAEKIRAIIVEARHMLLGAPPGV